jgi:hypothetical protein
VAALSAKSIPVAILFTRNSTADLSVIGTW